MAVQWHPEFSHSLKDEIINPEILLDVFMGFVKEGK
jgi:gamma-glutamyl-gamma-aminobutyrate hydrolase PuuD